MIYNKNKTYAFYYGDMDVDTVRSILQSIVRKPIHYGEMIIGSDSNLSLRDDRLLYNEGVVLTGIGDGNEWDNWCNSFLYVSPGGFNNGHLQEHCPDIVTVDLTMYDRIKPMTLCQSHEFS